MLWRAWSQVPGHARGAVYVPAVGGKQPSKDVLPGSAWGPALLGHCTGCCVKQICCELRSITALKAGVHVAKRVKPLTNAKSTRERPLCGCKLLICTADLVFTALFYV